MPETDIPRVEVSKHKPVLLQEAIDGLDLKDGETFVDATFGSGGHSREVEKRFPKARIIAIDQDPEAGVHTANFRDIDKVLGEERPDAILFDLGFSSDQLESISGLSFTREGPLDMRFSREGPTAADILNSYDEHAIELIIRGFGEERNSKNIAKTIVERRREKPFEKTSDLLRIFRPKSFRDRIHPATRTFQALRIAVNDELTALEEGIAKGFELLNYGGRIAVISFHSLEDRIVKNFFRDLAKTGEATLITKKPITPSEEELKENPRARSAKLRIIEKKWIKSRQFHTTVGDTFSIY